MLSSVTGPCGVCIVTFGVCCTEKIQVKKREVGYQETAKPLTAIEDFCERFDRAVKNTSTNVSTVRD